MDIRCEMLEHGSTVADRLNVDDELLLPRGDLIVQPTLAQGSGQLRLVDSHHHAVMEKKVLGRGAPNDRAALLLHFDSASGNDKDSSAMPMHGEGFNDW